MSSVSRLVFSFSGGAAGVTGLVSVLGVSTQSSMLAGLSAGLVAIATLELSVRRGGTVESGASN
jgi:hypothetical protein